jgi:hypothetical protein
MKVDRRYVLQAMSVGAALAPVLTIESAFADSTDSTTYGDGALKIVQMDDQVSFAKQIEHNVGPVVLLRTFLVKPEHVDKQIDPNSAGSTLCK